MQSVLCECSVLEGKSTDDSQWLFTGPDAASLQPKVRSLSPSWDLTSYDWAISKFSPPPPHPIPANTLPKSCPTSVPFLIFAWPDHSRVGGGRLNCRDCLVLQGPLARGQENRYNCPDMEGAGL